ncbi:MAG: hypothetical protein H0T62_12310 [Parachlamydiaceae bacterium]|nr:hypothetical protein [Parachlamydiaceae bacterium]
MEIIESQKYNIAEWALIAEKAKEYIAMLKVQGLARFIDWVGKILKVGAYQRD